MSGNYNMNNSNNKGSMRGGYQDTDGWIQQGSNKGRNNNTNPSFDPSKFKAKAVSGRRRDYTSQCGKPTNSKRHFFFLLRRALTIRLLWDHRIFSNGNTIRRQRRQHQWPIVFQYWNRTCISPVVYQVTDQRNHISRKDQWNVNVVCRKIIFISFARHLNAYNLYYIKILYFHPDGHGSRSGSQQGSRDNSAARSSYSSSRSLQQIRPTQMQFNTLPMNSSSMQKGGLRGDNKVDLSTFAYSEPCNTC